MKLKDMIAKLIKQLEEATKSIEELKKITMLKVLVTVKKEVVMKTPICQAIRGKHPTTIALLPPPISRPSALQPMQVLELKKEEEDIEMNSSYGMWRCAPIQSRGVPVWKVPSLMRLSEDKPMKVDEPNPVQMKINKIQLHNKRIDSERATGRVKVLEKKKAQ